MAENNVQTGESKCKITFINHASFKLDTERFSMLVDPWFTGSIFNDSWRLLKETPLDQLDLSNVKYFWISHEHPDHFNFPTLKALRKKIENPVTVFFQNLPDKSVRNELVKMGYNVIELDDGVEHQIEPGFTIRCFPCSGDSALLIDAYGTKIANSNDCALTEEHLRRMKDCCAGKPADLLLTQFGLAGYYANPEDAAGLKAARTFHIAQVQRYQEALQAKYVVPFASYIYFSRESNRYLNSAQVRLRELVSEKLNGGEYIIPQHEQRVWPVPESNAARSESNIGYWEGLENAERTYSVDPKATSADIEKFANCVIADLNTNFFRRRISDRTVLYVRDLKQLAIFDWKRSTFSLQDATGPTDETAGELTSGDLLFALKFPWGADTLNITSTFRVLHKEQWSWFVWTKNSIYSVNKLPLGGRLKNKFLLTAEKITSMVGMDLRDGNSIVWRAWDLVRGRRGPA